MSDTLAANVAQLRRLFGWSARELSERSGGRLSRSVIANIESGRKSEVTVDELVALAEALGVPATALDPRLEGTP